MFLECKKCKEDFELFDGQCIKSCNQNVGNSLITNIINATTSTKTCSKCADKNCIDCSTNTSLCNKCNLFYTLNNGSCSCKYLFY